MSTSEKEKTSAEARADVSGHSSPGRFEAGLARTLAYAESHRREERRPETPTDDDSATEPGEQ